MPQTFSKLRARRHAKSTHITSPTNLDGFGELLAVVQESGVHHDSKTIIDAVSSSKQHEILKAYKKAREQTDFNLSSFVRKHFAVIVDVNEHKGTSKQTPKAHIGQTWNVLTKEAPESAGSLVALPHQYVVPGGRFQEQFYWDSYFIMLGLYASDRGELADGMMKNITYMIRKFGFIPTANRTYFLTRSQPPFFARMVELAWSSLRQSITVITHIHIICPTSLRSISFGWTAACGSANATRPISAPSGSKME